MRSLKVTFLTLDLIDVEWKGEDWIYSSQDRVTLWTLCKRSNTTLSSTQWKKLLDSRGNGSPREGLFYIESIGLVCARFI